MRNMPKCKVHYSRWSFFQSQVNRHVGLILRCIYPFLSLAVYINFSFYLIENGSFNILPNILFCVSRKKRKTTQVLELCDFQFKCILLRKFNEFVFSNVKKLTTSMKDGIIIKKQMFSHLMF